MKRGSLAVLARDEGYVTELVNYLSKSRECPLIPEGFSCPDRFREFAAEHQIRLILAEEELAGELGSSAASPKLVLLQEKEGGSKTCPAIYKYQSAKAVAAQIAKICGQERSALVPAAPGITGIYSPSGNTGKTAFAVTLAQIRSECERVLYINAEAYSGFYQLFTPKPPVNLADLMYLVGQGRKDIREQIDAAVLSWAGFSFLMPPLSPMDVRDIPFSDWQDFLTGLMAGGSFERLVLELDDHTDGLFELLEQCSIVYMPVGTGVTAEHKTAQFDQLLELGDYQRLRALIRRIDLRPYLPKGSTWLSPEELAAGKLGRYIRSMIEQEEREDR